MIDINELRRLAQAATPGPWKLLPVGDKSKCFAVADINLLSVLTVVDECGTSFGAVYLDGDAKFIAAANPAAVNELLDRLEAAESVLKDFGTTVQEVECWLERYRCIERGAEALRTRLEAAEADALEQARMNGMGSEREAALMAKLEAAEKERDALRAKVEVMERQEPVAWLHETRPDSGVVTDTVKRVWEEAVVGSLSAYSIPLCIATGAQPAPSVPEKIKRVESGFKGMFLREAQAYKQGWNECRAAMIAPAREAKP